MSSQKRISFILVVLISCAFVVLIIFVATSLRKLGSQAAAQKAGIVAELVEDSLTTMMINGIMDNREDYLRKIANTKNIDSLWLTRAPSVIKQYGKGFNNEIPRDEIDHKVIKEAKAYDTIIETPTKVQLRFTVPYISTEHGNPNCLACHDSKEGEALGTISMIFDITDSRNESIIAILYMIGASILIIGIVLWVINRSLRPFMEIFDSINNVMKHARDGDYSKRVLVADAQTDAKKVATWINEFFENLENTLNFIQEKLQDFFSLERNHKQKDPLIEAKEAVSEMSRIYKFKNTIESDRTKAKVYERFAVILTEDFKLSNFQIIESDSTKGETLTYYSSQDKPNSISIKARAFKTKKAVYSSDFKDICDICSSISEFYSCLIFSVEDHVSIMIHFIHKNEAEIDNIKSISPMIKNYLEALKPEIVSKNLNEVLKQSSITDQLTGLNNRAYLDEFIEKVTSQALRKQIPLGILMLDIDFFKIVNDTYGHDVGDRAIRALSQTIKTSIRESDIPFRYGGEEFLVILYGCELDDIFETAEKIRLNFEKITIEANGGKTFSKTISIGCSSFPQHSTSIWSCIKFSDIALYRAKESGRNQTIVFNETMLDEGEKQTYKPNHS